MTGWIWMVLAIGFEVAGTTAMKLSDGFTRLTPSIVMAVCYAVSLTCLTFALRTLDIGVAYAVWSGLGTALIATIGVLWFGEPRTLLKLVSLLAIIGGVVGLNLGSRG